MRYELIERLKRDFQDEEARYAYVEDFLNSHIAIQLKGLRELRQLSQEQLAARFGTKQSGISRLENVNYSSWKVETLRKLARALGVRLRISFEEFGTLIEEIDDLGNAIKRREFKDDPVFSKQREAETKAAQSAPFQRLVEWGAFQNTEAAPYVGDMERATKAIKSFCESQGWLGPADAFKKVAIALRVANPQNGLIADPEKVTENALQASKGADAARVSGVTNIGPWLKRAISAVDDTQPNQDMKGGRPSGRRKSA
jgi:transcriptional regulator with XRE-family HTH domain